MKRILIISFSVIRNDPRVMRQIKLLNNRYSLTVAGFGPPPSEDIQYIELNRPTESLPRKILFAFKLGLRRFESYYWGMPQVKDASKKIAGGAYDLIIANDVSALPLSLAIKGRGKVLIDAHEYSPREFDDNWIWRLFFKGHYEHICTNYLQRADGMITVCEGIANEYQKNYGMKPAVVFNAPCDQGLMPTPVLEDRIRLIHHGSSMRSRHLELMIHLMKILDDRFTLDFMLVETDKAYMKELRALASNDSRIRFLPAVEMDEICSYINNYDIGLYILPPVNFNHEQALPNKFFEFVQARLAVAIGPSPEMARIIQQYSCGLVATSFEPKAMADCLQKLTLEDLQQLKNAAATAALHLNFESSAKVLLEKIDQLLS